MLAQQESTQKHTSTPGVTLLEGAALVVVAPLVVPALLLGLRPVAKTVIKGSLILTDTVTHLATAAGEGWRDLLAESRAAVRPVPDQTEAVPAEPAGAHTTFSPIQEASETARSAPLETPSAPVETTAAPESTAPMPDTLAPASPATVPVDVPAPPAAAPAALPAPPAGPGPLARIPGLGGPEVELLQRAGVHTVSDLARCNPAVLHTELQQIQAREQHLAEPVLLLEQVAAWVTHATEITCEEG